MLSFGQNAIAYQKALKYITNKNAGKNMVVSDTIYHLPFHNFTEEICNIWGKDNDFVSGRLDSVDRVQENKKFVLNEFKNLKFVGKEPTEIIYFSNFYSLMVIGEIIERKNKKRGVSHDAQTGFNESTQYLFIFDKKYSLKRVFKIRLAYD
jgi:hypothetical protein